jgi:ABC-type transport system substrate-binding protein
VDPSLILHQDIAMLNARDNLEVMEADELWVTHFWINSHRAPFNDQTMVPDPDFGGIISRGALIRRALAYAIDRERMREEVFEGYGNVANSAVPTAWPDNNASFEPYPYDPEKAKSILRDLGYEVKDGKKSGWDPFISLFSTMSALICLLFLRKRFRLKNG